MTPRNRNGQSDDLVGQRSDRVELIACDSFRAVTHGAGYHIVAVSSDGDPDKSKFDFVMTAPSAIDPMGIRLARVQVKGRSGASVNRTKEGFTFPVDAGTYNWLTAPSNYGLRFLVYVAFPEAGELVELTDSAVVLRCKPFMLHLANYERTTNLATKTHVFGPEDRFTPEALTNLVETHVRELGG